MKSINKNKSNKPKLPSKDPVELSQEENSAQLELELCWCIQQIENALNSGKLSKKQADDSGKNLKVLKSSTSALVKKRQVMKAAFGDYRSKMKEEEKKMSLGAKQIKFTQPKVSTQKANFVKKSAILTSGKDFKFNFNTENKEDENQAETKLDSNVIKVNTIHPIKNTESPFKFNFAVVHENNDINFDSLKITS